LISFSRSVVNDQCVTDLGHLVVDFEDDAFGAVLVATGLTLALYDGLQAHDSLHRNADKTLVFLASRFLFGIRQFP
jgi:hypothetical protein